MTNISLLLKEAITHYHANRLNVAESLYRAILALDQDHAEAHHNLGMIEIKLEKPESGLKHLQRAVVLESRKGSYWLSLAEELLAAKRIDEAHDILNHLIRMKLNTSAVQRLRKQISEQKKGIFSAKETASIQEQKVVVSLLEKRQFIEAESKARKLVARYPTDAFGWKATGTLLFKRGLFEDSLNFLLKAVQLNPKDAECLNNLGNTLQNLNRPNEALDCYKRSLEIGADYAAAYNSVGVTLESINRIEEAIDNYRRALALDPNLSDAFSNLGVALRKIQRLSEALDCFQRALKVDPDNVKVYNNIGAVLEEIGQLDEAIAAYEKAIVLDKNSHSLNSYSNLLFALNYHPDKPAEDIFLAYQKYDKYVQQDRQIFWQTHKNDPNPNRRLHIGYISPDFRAHSTCYFLEPLLAYHDQDTIEVTAYAELKVEDEVTARYRQYVDHWVAIRGLSETTLAERIRADGIDILVDLAGQTADNRLTVFARRPAPIAVSWLGYGYTTGLSAIDYFLTDEIMVPIGCETLFSERPWRIAVPSMVYRPNPKMGDIDNLPALTCGAVTFGTLTRGIRINHHVIRVWVKILQRLPNARLIINSGGFQTTPIQNQFLEFFTAHGIASERIDIGYNTPGWDVLQKMDISLDCFPHNSGTTLIESLYMGVPFITLASRPSVGRIGSTILHGAGHPEWIAQTEDEYIEKAVALASDLPRLAVIRANLRSELEASPWRDEVGFAKRVEQAYREMWQIWCANPT
ncbi:tetratricopeptide repeat protein [Chromatium okenii]|jgi:predicted O-linked N-acetylglucosamine transferase (SPINDLY family)|uniref:protein O-GlcNAc transferase n=1 Tax=Chromatium okenii TaxID=61644 RepID=A0A2S7XR23_9GAMM|nr:tetratricopeptide repeat protein [Chromatium okenii]PQJ95918.1 glycosyltransferase [Chromatium okenii]